MSDAEAIAVAERLGLDIRTLRMTEAELGEYREWLAHQAVVLARFAADIESMAA